MNRFNAEIDPKNPRPFVLKVADRVYNFLAPEDPRWEPLRRKMRDRVNPYLKAKQAAQDPGLTDEQRQMLEAIGFVQLVEQDDEQAREAMSHAAQGIMTRAEYWIEGLSIANPEHTKEEWTEFVMDLPVSAARSIRIEPADPA